MQKVVKQTDAKRAVSEKSYDSKGNVISETGLGRNMVTFLKSIKILRIMRHYIKY